MAGLARGVLALSAFALGLVAACAEPPPPLARGPSAAPDRWVSAEDASPRRPSAEGTAGHDAEGKDFAAEVRLLFRVVACAGDAELPPELDARVVEAHCAELLPRIKAARARVRDLTKPFLSALVPPDAPTEVVYPFAGGDLVTALTTYPRARTFTTLSLELAGDPRRLGGLGRRDLEQSLGKLRGELDELIAVEEYSRSETLKRTQRGDIPGELAFFLVGLAVHDAEPVSLRYFDVQPDGGLHYLSGAEIDAVESRLAEHKKGTWWPPDFSEAFANAEIVFRDRGAPSSAPPRVHRHLAVNLADDHLAHTPGVVRHLEDKGRVVALTKAASYLLWTDGFSRIRDLLLGHMTMMVSDSTGIPPAFAGPSGFAQETYGSFRGSLLRASPRHNAAFRKLWDSQPRRKLPFRYGYRDAAGQDHLLVTRKLEAPR